MFETLLLAAGDHFPVDDFLESLFVRLCYYICVAYEICVIYYVITEQCIKDTSEDRVYYIYDAF